MQRAATAYDDNIPDNELSLFYEDSRTKDIAIGNRLIEK